MAVTISMQFGEALDGVGEGLFVDLGVLGADAVADGAVGGRRRIRNSSRNSNPICDAPSVATIDIGCR